MDMVGGTEVGAVYLDFVVRDTIQKQVDRLARKAQTQAQGTFDKAGAAAGKAMSGAFDKSFSKTLELAKKKLDRLEAGYREAEARVAELEAAKTADYADFYKGKPEALNSAVQDALAGDKAYQKAIAAADRAYAQMLAARDRVEVEIAAVADRQAKAEQAAAEKAAAASERAAQRAAAAEQRAARQAAEEQERAAQRARAAAEKAAQHSSGAWGKASGVIQRLFRSIGSAAKSAFLMTGIYAAFRGLAAMLGDAAAQNKQFSASLANVKAALSTAFTPILNVVLPALTALMNGIAAVLNTIGALLGKVFGTAGAAQKQLDGVGSAAGGAAKQVKKATATLGMDELNVIDQQEDAGGGGGGAGGALGGMAEQGAVLDGLMEKAKAFWRDFSALYEPSIAAWSAAWDTIREKAVAVWPDIKRAALGLWNDGLKPLGRYLATDFAPSVVNAFSEAFAPIVGDVVSARLQIFADVFAFRCRLMTDAIHSLLIPALELVKDIWQGMMEGVQSTWETYGKPVCDGAVQAVQGLLGILQALWDTVVKPFLQFCMEKLSELWDAHLKPLWDNLVGLAADITLTVMTFWNSVLAPLLTWVTQTFGPYLEAAFEGIASVVSVVVGTIADLANVIITALRGVLQFLTAVFRGDWDAAWQAVADTASSVWNGIKNTIRGAVNGIIGIVNGMISAICSGLNAIIGMMNKLSFDIPDWVPVVGGSHFGLSIPTITAPQIPMLAQGGYVGPNQPQLAMIGDNRREGEIVAPESKLREAVAQGLAAMPFAQMLELLREMAELLRALLAKDTGLRIGDEEIYNAYEKAKERKGYPVGLNPRFGL